VAFSELPPGGPGQSLDLDLGERPGAGTVLH
jgi:hypothetical protein